MSKGNFSKITETTHRASSERAPRRQPIQNMHSISKVGYINAVPAFVCFEIPARVTSSFCDFWKLTSCDSIAFIFSLIEVNFFLMCLLRINLPNLCPNMIQVNVLDFSEWHSEEVISFFWGSMYIESYNLGYIMLPGPWIWAWEY